MASTVDVARLEKEIQSFHAGLSNMIAARAAHPTYGYTKQMVRDAYQRLQGMLAGWLYVTGRWDHAGTVLASTDKGLAGEDATYRAIRVALGIDLRATQTRVAATLAAKRKWM